MNLKQYKPKRRRITVPASHAQEWARRRNWNKRRLMGVLAAIDDLVYNELTTDAERAVLFEALRKLRAIKRDYSKESIFSKAEYLRRHR